MRSRLSGWTWVLALWAVAALGAGCYFTPGPGGTCGGAGQACCGVAPVCNSGLACNGSTCVGTTPTCGGLGQACCAGAPQCAGAGVACNASGICVQTTSTCGNIGQACCAGGQCLAAGSACNASGLCVSTSTGGRRQYEPCVSGEACLNGTTCGSANLSLTGGAPGGFCTATCTPGGTCPVDPNGLQAACVVASGVGECYQRCPTGGGCPFGTTCANPSGTTEAVCVPNSGVASCGHNGEACCAGANCVDGSVCGTSNVCVAPPGPYDGCAPIGATCAGGTTCQQPMISNPGPTGWCTNTCFGSGTGCAGLPGQITDCYILENSSGGQCYVACPSGGGCPTGTTCVMTNTATTFNVRLCMPNPSF